MNRYFQFGQDLTGVKARAHTLSLSLREEGFMEEVMLQSLGKEKAHIWENLPGISGSTQARLQWADKESFEQIFF